MILLSLLIEDTCYFKLPNPMKETVNLRLVVCDQFVVPR